MPRVERDARVMLETLRARCLERGLDVHGACALGTYEAATSGSGASMRTASSDDRACVALVGNSRALWGSFVDALMVEPGLDLESYVRRTVVTAAAAAARDGGGAATRVYWASDVDAGKVVAIQRLAECCGVAYLEESTHQSVHAEFGPWVAFRAAVVFDDARGPSEEEDARKRMTACPASDDAVAKAKAAFDIAVERYQASNGDDAELWKFWLAARIAMEDGDKFAKHRYYDEQILWHYDVDRVGVRANIAARHRAAADL